MQERIAESERRREHKPSPPAVKQALANVAVRNNTIKLNQKIGTIHNGEKLNKTSTINNITAKPPVINQMKIKVPILNVQSNKRPNTVNVLTQEYKASNSITPIVTNPSVVTTIITESSTITIPIHTTTRLSSQVQPKYKTMPSPTRILCNPELNVPQLTLNEIFEENDGHMDSNIRQTPRQFVSRSQTRTTYEQRKSKFHKNRTASCSSSDASDDDSESRKKRAHKLNNNGKPLPGRRDSHDDSSDSQDQGGSGGMGGSSGHQVSGQQVSNRCNDGPSSTGSKPDSRNGNSTNTTGGRKNQGSQPVMLSRRHRTGRRRTGETRLRESQSLNRISEVQEDTHQTHNFVISATLTAAQSQTGSSPRLKNFGAKILQGWSLGSKKNSPVENNDKGLQKESNPKEPMQCKASNASDTEVDRIKESFEEKENYSKVLSDKTGTKKIRLLGKYFQVHKKICIPLPGLFGRNRLHKTQSCNSLLKDKITPSTIDSVALCSEIIKKLPTSNDIKNNVTNESDINQNLGTKNDNVISGPIVQLNTVCSGIGGICSLHLGDASKCCSLC